MKIINIRRSIRNFDSNKPITEEMIEALLRAGMQAPSARNEQPWEFLVIDERALIDKMVEGLPAGKMLLEAPLAIIVLGNKNRYKTMFYHCDLGACTQNILLEATELGLGTCWIGCQEGEPRGEYLHQLFALPEDVVVYATIAIGFPKNPVNMQYIDRYNATYVHRNRW